MTVIALSLRTKVLLLSCFLFTIPWFAYQYVWEMEKYLRFGQEQTLVGTARALATALHERPKLFDNQASFLPRVEKGKDLYAYQLQQPIQLDGLMKDWPLHQERSHFYHSPHLISQQSNRPLSVQFNALVGKYDKYLYLWFSVYDDRVLYRPSNSLSITNNDHLSLALVDENQAYRQFIISNKQDGWIDAFAVKQATNELTPEPKLQGVWRKTAQGYNVELRLPVNWLGDKLAFAVHDVDQLDDAPIAIGSANPADISALGTILVPSPEIERIVKGMRYTNSSIWVIDQHRRVLASAGNLQSAVGVWSTKQPTSNSESYWQTVYETAIKPLYYKVLTKPPESFIDTLYDAGNFPGEHIKKALAGQPESQWRLTEDQQAVVLSAAYPIFIDEQVHGVVVVEETTNGIRSLRNLALEKLFSAMLAILLTGTLVFFIFAVRISRRIRVLRDQTERAIDAQGKIVAQVTPSETKDEIGDLSRSFANIVNKLGQYNRYLENMSSRLAHELRTPIAVVRTSLDNLALQPLPKDSEAYMERAQSGINRLNLMINNMTEATRLEQMLVTAECTAIDINQLVDGCIKGYQQIYPDISFDVKLATEPLIASVSPEHIVQMLDKIIANAGEFSIDKKITVIIKAIKTKVEICVSNKGPLLPVDMEERLFDSMVSIRTDNDQACPHLGLGLFIARLIANFHRGQIFAQNLPDKTGVIVSVQLPKFPKSQ